MKIKIKHCPSCGSSKIKKHFDETYHCLNCPYIFGLDKQLELKTYKEVK